MKKKGESGFLNIGNISIVIIIALIMILAIYNIFKNENFYDVNASSILTLLIAVIFAYFLNQRRLNERKKKDQIERLLQKMQNSMSEKNITIIESDEDLNYNLMFQRGFDNRITILSNLNSSLIDKDILKYIKDNFEEYKNVIGDNFQNINKLKDSEKKLKRLVENIDYKLDELLLSLYK